MRAAAKRAHASSKTATVNFAGWAGSVVRSIPGAAGALLISYGAWEAWQPGGLMVAGAFLLLADRKMP